MPVRTTILGALALFAATVALYGQSAASLPCVTESDIIQGLREKGIVVRPAQVSLLANVPARMEHPVLEVQRIESLSVDASRVLMRCADQISCIPFYAVVNGLARGERLADEKQAVRKSILENPGRGPVMVKQGTTATLELFSPDMLITIPVVCLQNGRRGERIKVASIDRKQTYTGEIVTHSLLRSQL
jgi:hypothetical protein